MITDVAAVVAMISIPAAVKEDAAVIVVATNTGNAVAIDAMAVVDNKIKEYHRLPGMRLVIHKESR